MSPPPTALIAALTAIFGCVLALALALYAQERLRTLPVPAVAVETALSSSFGSDGTKSTAPLVRIVNGAAAAGSAADVADGGQEAARIILASVPRSGNHYVRSVIEHATHIGTEAVYNEGGAAARGTWSNRTRSFYAPVVSSAHVRRAQAHEAVVVKTHWPFHRPEMKPVRKSAAARNRSEDQVDMVLKPIREPIGNWLAWIRWCVVRARRQKIRNSGISRVNASSGVVDMLPRLSDPIEKTELDMLHPSDKSFAGFMTKWSLFHEYWRNVSASLDVPLVEFRFEDLEAPERVEQVFERVLAVLPFTPTSQREYDLQLATDRVPFLSHSTDRVLEVHPHLCTLLVQIVGSASDEPWDALRLARYAPMSEFYDAQLFREHRRTYYRRCEQGIPKGALADLA